MNFGTLTGANCIGISDPQHAFATQPDDCGAETTAFSEFGLDIFSLLLPVFSLVLVTD